MKRNSSDQAPSRREVIKGTGALGLAGLVAACGETETKPSAQFLHGVASGDPLPDAVILWSRVTVDGSAPVQVAWEIGTDAALTVIVQKGSAVADPQRDFTVKVDVRGLLPATTYYYRFSALGAASPVGRTRTAPQGDLSRARFAVVSCSSFAQGYFHAYRALAARTDVDLVLHLGDYIYESASGDFGSARPHKPPHECVTLVDYRTRYAQYRQDADLQEIHRQFPFVVVWDDHETANNAWKSGAENHQAATEGIWADRKAAGQRAFLEWIPIREQSEPTRIWRALSWGNLADLVMLDTRLWGRDETDPGIVGPAPADDLKRSLLGDDQAAWLEEQIRGSKAQWKLIGQQVMVGNLILQPNTLINLDQWQGYPASRRRLLDFLGSSGSKNVVVLTGDIHSSFANELVLDPNDPALYDPATGKGAVAVEFVTPGITSPGLPATYIPFVEMARKFNPQARWFDLSRQGYMVLDVTPDRVQAAWFLYADITKDKPSPEEFAAAWSVQAGQARLIQDKTPA